MSTYPLATLGPTVDSTGISTPTYEDVWLSLKAIYQGIFGSDIYIEADSQDGQFIAAIAQAIHNSNQASVTVFNSFSPTYAQGEGLSARVKINGLSRNVSSYSTATVHLVGSASATITNGVIKDTSGYLWDLPSSVTLGVDGTATTTATCETAGSISAAEGAINIIYNPQYGWTSVTNTDAATEGNAVETDTALRVRQSNSTALPAQAILESVYSYVGNLAGVTRLQVYENDTDATDVNGIPPHSICVVVEGGTAATIAAAIQLKKTPGAGTYGTTSVSVSDSRGISQLINYFILASTRLYMVIVVKAIAGFASSTTDAIKTALVDYVSGLSVGDDVYYAYASGVASLTGKDAGKTFYLSTFYIGISANPTGVANVTIPFNAAATLSADDITITVE